MELLRYILLGILQGITEFLPVSSSGHLVLVELLWGSGGFGQQDLFLNVMLHLGTLAAVALFCRRELAALVHAALRLGRPTRSPEEAAERRLLIAVAIASLPTALLGIVVKLTLVEAFSHLLFVGAMFLITAGVLWISTRYRGEQSEATPKTAFAVGAAQGLAVLPGISRSGATIVTGLAMGLNREAAARFAFLISIPAILGAAAVSLLDIQNLPKFNTSLIFSLSCGTIAAAFAGYFSLVLLTEIVRKARLNLFSYYCAAVGITAIILGCIR